MEIAIIANGFDIQDGPLLNQGPGKEQIPSKRLVVIGVDGNSLAVIVPVEAWEQHFVPFVTDQDSYLEKRKAEMEAAEARAKIALPGLVTGAPGVPR